MLLVALISIALVGLTALMHYEVLRGLTWTLPAMAIPPRTKVLVVILTEFMAHVLEITVYGLAILLLTHWNQTGSLSGAGGATVLNCMYFSAETFTSLGFGDLVPVGSIRPLAGVEALNGLLLIGWSASYAYIAMERFWSAGGDSS